MNQAEIRSFPLGVVLTATTGKMLSREGFGAFHEFAEFMTSGPVWTHEFGTGGVGDVLKADVMRQHPDLPTEAEVDGETWDAWLSAAEAKHGATREVEPIPDYGRTKGPVETLAALATPTDSPTKEPR
jgi:hypothetical protein